MKRPDHKRCQTTVSSTPQAQCKVGIARVDITPPIGIYHRMWGAAMHDQAEGVHRPLSATALLMEPIESGANGTQILLAIDHCLLDGEEMQRLRQGVASAIGCKIEEVSICLSHTHGSGWMSRSRSHLPGGEKIGPYLDELREKLIEVAKQAKESLAPAHLTYGVGRCNLAAHRDFWDEKAGRFVCGFNPDGPADDTLVVVRISDEVGAIRGVLVNYACHPTTLAWDNRAISPDWIGAMRETVEGITGGLCLFVQGASGELGPKEGFVGDWAVADRNGRQVGYAVATTLESLPTKAGTEFVYAGPVISGTWIGTWKHEAVDSATKKKYQAWRWNQPTVNLTYRAELPTMEETLQEKAKLEQLKQEAKEAGDAEKERDYHAQIEQMTRQQFRLASLPAGKCYPLPVTIGQLGDALWVLVPAEMYQMFQVELRKRFAPRPVIVGTLTNNWQPGYLPDAVSYGYGIYQDVIAAVAPGALEALLEGTVRQLTALLDE